MKPALVELIFSDPRPPHQSKEPSTRPPPSKGRRLLKENAGFRYSKSLGVKSAERMENGEKCHIHGISLSKLTSSKSSYLNTDSALIAQHILKEQEEIMELFENSAFLTHSLSRMEGLTEYQHFIRAFEEVERAKYRLLYGPYPSRKCSGDEDQQSLETDSTISIDSLDLTPRRHVQSVVFDETIPSLQQSIREDVYQEMHDLLSSDDDEEDGPGELLNSKDSLNDIQLELQRRIPSKLDFKNESSIHSHARRDRYIGVADDFEESVVPSPSLRQQELQQDIQNEKVITMMVDSLPEWLVLCVRSYESVYNNDQAWRAHTGRGGEFGHQLERTARKYLQVERYLEKMERELSQITSTAHERKRSRKKGGIPHQVEAEAKVFTQKQLMSRSSNFLVPKGTKPREEGVQDDENVVYHSSSISTEMMTKKEIDSTLWKGRMLLLSAAISFGEAVGQIIVNEAFDNESSS